MIQDRLKSAFVVLSVTVTFALWVDAAHALNARRAPPKPVNPQVISFTVNTGDGASKVVPRGKIEIPATVASQGVSVIANMRRKTLKPKKVVLKVGGLAVSQTRAPFSFFRASVGASSFRSLPPGVYTLTAQPYLRVQTKRGPKLKGLKILTLQITVPATGINGLPTVAPTATSPIVAPTQAFPTLTPTPTPTPTPTQLPRRASPFVFPSVPPANVAAQVPNYVEWTEHMTQYASNFCDRDYIFEPTSQFYEGKVWNFDGLRAYYNIFSFTGDSRWLTCAGYLRELYRGYVIDNNGEVPGRRIFAGGLLLDWRHTLDQSPQNAELSSTAIRLLATNAAFATTGGRQEVEYSSETANLINAYLASEEVGQPQNPRMPDAINFALGHLQQWQQGIQGDFQPYLVAVTFDALVNWYVATGDVRVPPAVEAAANWLWMNYWSEANQSFPSIVCQPGSTNVDCGQNYSGADLNLMFAPSYAWLAKVTGSATQHERADKLFAGGVTRAYLERGKQFSQNYSTSFNFITHLQ